MGQTTSEYIANLIQDYYNMIENQKCGIHMTEKGRTMAFQIPEELFQRIKRHLERETLRTGKKLTQRDFVLNLITQALDEADAESAAEQDFPAEAPVEARVADEATPADTDTPDVENHCGKRNQKTLYRHRNANCQENGSAGAADSLGLSGQTHWPVPHHSRNGQSADQGPSHMVPLRGLKDLPGTDTVRLRPIGFYVGDPAGLPAPGVVDQQLGVDAKQLIEQRLVIVFPGLPDGAPGDISHGIDADGLELFGIAFSHPPEVGQRAMHPKLSAVAHFIQLRDPDTALIRRDVFGHDVHSDLAKIEVCADLRGRGDPRCAQHIKDHGSCQFPRRHVILPKVTGGVDHHLINGVDTVMSKTPKE